MTTDAIVMMLICLVGYVASFIHCVMRVAKRK